MFGLILLSVVCPALIGMAIYDAFDNSGDNSHDDDSSDVSVTESGGESVVMPLDSLLSDGASDDTSTEEGEVLTFDGSDILMGTNGDDTLPAGQDGALAPSEIYLLDGDDTAEIDVPYWISVYGGDGDDTLSGDIANSLYGEAGDDTLVGIDATNLYGGAGNDDITWNSDTELNDMTSRIDGGDGDDRIEINAEAGTDQPDRGGAYITGGDGSDEFVVNLELQNSENDLQRDDGLVESRIATIGDFDPSQDTLSIAIERTPGAEDREISVDMVQGELENGQYETTITLSYAATDGGLAATTTLTNYSDSPFELEDIEFTGLEVA